MSADPWDNDDEQHTQFFGLGRGAAPESTRTISPAEHAELVAEAQAAAAAPQTDVGAPPTSRPTRPPVPPPLPSMRTTSTPATAPRPEAESVAARVPPSVHGARATAALVDSLTSLEAAEDHLRRCGVGSPDLAIVKQLLLGVLDGVHLRGWAP